MLRLSAFSPSLSLSVHCLPAPPIPPPVVARRRRGLLPHGARFLALALPFLSRDEALSHLATLPQHIPKPHLTNLPRYLTPI